MPIVTFRSGTRVAEFRVEVEEGKSLYEAALQAGLPVASSCGGEATCGKCNMKVLAGEGNLSPRDAQEEKLLHKEKKPATDRISCLARIYGDCEATTTYW